MEHKFSDNIECLFVEVNIGKTIVRIPSFLKVGGGGEGVGEEEKILINSPGVGRLPKIKKAGELMVQGQVFLRGDCHFSYFNFFYYHNVMRKIHSKLSKNEPENIP